MADKPTRGERNNNPGNIRHGDQWFGLSDAQTDSAFCTFDRVELGIRAICKIMLSYRNKGFDTVCEIVQRWAPPSENDTGAYVASVARRMNVDPDTHIDVRRYAEMYPLVDAIIRHENGRNIYPRSTVDQGLALAGIAP
jgi:hypothetical protein